jgi:hypothetical protein
MGQPLHPLRPIQFRGGRITESEVELLARGSIIRYKHGLPDPSYPSSKSSSIALVQRSSTVARRENDAGVPPDLTHGSSVTENTL